MSAISIFLPRPGDPNWSARLTLLILVLLTAGELPALFLPPAAMVIHRLFHLLQMLWLIALGFAIRHEIGHAAVFSPRLSRAEWQRVASLLVCGALLSFVGDVINAGVIDLTALLQPQTLLSIPPFAAAHGCYLAAFMLLSRAPLQGSTRLRGLTLAAVPLLAIGVWSCVIPADAPRLVIGASLAYSFVLAAMVAGSLWVAWAWGRSGGSVALGGVLFLLSDALLGYYLLRERPFWAGQLIWSTYMLAQLLIQRSGLLYRPPAASRQAPS
ncbi:MAG: lysoplasmalogenase [candidate division KSB1 bacterium]|nr:lysoplasmalogenase [candidate division KSB1 bacterium]MDZ7275541.1 lysoplasmalogenase [candidate division KSB1 bacterium]MDZ7286147.1 lysoplasmalogenase [candidate division KSB1 bacterium]MDZ7296373.1 lysoplasmalogenase [candidate division KSB1 bacterium]MDZ7309345.1 lysoplasmalogenase [candidate division KSB1 bacterium]